MEEEIGIKKTLMLSIILIESSGKSYLRMSEEKREPAMWELRENIQLEGRSLKPKRAEKLPDRVPDSCNRVHGMLHTGVW